MDNEGIYIHTGYVAIFLTVVILLFSAPSAALARNSAQSQLTPRQMEAVITARNHIETGNPDRAVSTLRPVAKTSRPPLIILDHLAWAQTEAGNGDAALMTYQQAAELYPEDATTVRNFGLMQLRRGDPTKGANTLIRAYGLQNETDKEPALLALAASALIQEEAFAKALPLLRQAGRDSGDMPVNWSSLAVYCCIQLNRIDEALEYSRTCTRRHPESAEAWSLLSRVLVRKGDSLAAAAALETALSFGKDTSTRHRLSPTPLMQLASLYARGHANAEAAQRLSENGEPDSATRAAQYHYLAGQFEAALLMLDSQSNQGPPMQSLRKALLKGRTLIHLGRAAEAVDVLTKTIAITVPPADRNAANRIRATAYLLAGESLWMDKKWTEAAATFDTLATIPGYGKTGASLAKAMRALIRETANGIVSDTPD